MIVILHPTIEWNYSKAIRTDMNDPEAMAADMVVMRHLNTVLTAAVAVISAKAAALRCSRASSLAGDDSTPCWDKQVLAWAVHS